MKRNKIFLLTFVAILLLPLLDSIFNFLPVKDLFEKRLPVAMPDMPKNFAEVKEFPRQFENFFNDNYGGRKTLITINSHMMDKVFNESPDARAVIGKDGWLYFDNHNSLLDATGRAQISDEMIARGVESFGRNWQKMRAKNINYLLVIAADKSTIYPEFLPDYIVAKGPHRIDKFLTALKAKYPDFPVVDLRPTLLAAKKNEIIYHKTDTHWNKRGAHYGYVEIMHALAKKDRRFVPHLRDKYLNKEDEMLRGDISDIMNSQAENINYDLVPKDGVHYQRNGEIEAQLKHFHKIMVFETANKDLPVLFSYKDSFFAYLNEFVPSHFSRSIYANEFPCDLNYEILKNQRPDVVIQEFWEGRLEVILSQCKQ